MAAGVFVASSVALGTDYESLVQLRMQVRTHLRRDTALYKCARCGVAVHICRSPKEPKFFFKHRHEDGSCPAVTAGNLNQADIDARKYNGVKESRLHLLMKEWLVKSLAADPEFSQVRAESVWKGAWSAEWRKPDVQAMYRGLRIAFEIQLSTTFLEVIAARRSFYLQEGGLLFWIFARFDTDRTRMTEDDVFYNNNQNAFVIDEKTVEFSRANTAFHLECVWATPVAGGQVSGLHRKTVAFNELTLDPDSQRGFYYDFDQARVRLRQAADSHNEALREDFERIFASGELYGDAGAPLWSALRARFAKAGISTSRYPGGLPYPLLFALYSAKHGRPYIGKRKLLVETCHAVANGEKENLRWFSKALRFYGRGPQLKAEDKSKRWVKRVMACRDEEALEPSLYEPDRSQQPLIEFLFPEICPLP